MTEPAFPHPSGAQGCDGLSKRDWFAGMALVGMGTWSPGAGIVDLHSDRAKWAYGIADAMIAESKKGGAE